MKSPSSHSVFQFASLVVVISTLATLRADPPKRPVGEAPQTFSSPAERIESLLTQRFGYGRDTIGGAEGEMTEIVSLTDDSLLNALTDDTPRWIFFNPSLDGGVWHVPNGSTPLGRHKTVDARDVSITWQYGFPENNRGINLPPVKNPPKTGQLNAQKGELILAGLTHIGDLGWPYVYEAPYFSNGATDGLEIWGGSNYWIHENTWKRMSDESLGMYHNQGGSPDLITFSNNTFLETKTASLIGNALAPKRARITIAYNRYHPMVNGRSPGEFRNVDAHVFNNWVSYVNDEGLRVGTGARVISETNVFDIGCNPAVSGPRVIRYVLPNETPLGVLHSTADLVSDEAIKCPSTIDEGYLTDPAPRPFDIPYAYELLRTREEIDHRAGAPQW